jgi:hypothetical protein
MTVAAMAVSLAGCGPSAVPSTISGTLQPSQVAAAPTTVATAAQSPAASAPQCETTFNPLDPGSKQGSVKGSVTSGHVLLSVEGTQDAGTIALLSVGKDGTTSIPIGDDRSFGHPVAGPGASIVFDSERNGDRHLFRMAANGTSVVQLTSGAGLLDFTPRFTRDFSRLGYEHVGCNTSDLGIRVAGPDGSNPQAPTQPFPAGKDQGEGQISFSPDGTHLVLSRGGPDLPADRRGIWIIATAGGDERRIAGPDIETDEPRWSPDGRWILFTGSQPGGDTDIWIVGAEGGTPRQLLHHKPGNRAWWANWSPGGTTILFSYYESGWDHNEVRLVNADGSSERVLWAGERSVAEASWGP